MTGSNRHRLLGRQRYYHYTNTAFGGYDGIWTRYLNSDSVPCTPTTPRIHLVVQERVGLSFRPYQGRVLTVVLQDHWWRRRDSNPWMLAWKASELTVSPRRHIFCYFFRALANLAARLRAPCFIWFLIFCWARLSFACLNVWIIVFSYFSFYIYIITYLFRYVYKLFGGTWENWTRLTWFHRPVS